MAQKKTKLDIAAERTAEIIQAHLDSLPRAEARTMRAEIHRLAVKASRSASAGKTSRSRQSGAPRPLSRGCAESA